jgi:hypothetical protein
VVGEVEFNVGKRISLLLAFTICDDSDIFE